MDKRNLSILGYIPARANSKGIPNKHLRILNGKRVIEYTLEAAIESKLLDKIIVSTDSDEIAQIALAYGVEVPFLRPGELARDDSDIVSSISHLIDYLEKNENFSPDIFVSLFPTNPFRRKGFVDEVIETFLEDKKRNGNQNIRIAQLLACTPWPQGKITYLRWLENNEEIEVYSKINRLLHKREGETYRISGSISPHVYSLNTWRDKFGVELRYTSPHESETGNEQWENVDTGEKMVREAFILKEYESVELDDPIDYFRAIAVAKNMGRVR